MLRAPDGEAGVAVAGAGGVGVGHKAHPDRAVGRDLDAIAGDGCTAVVGRRAPRQVDLRLTVRRDTLVSTAGPVRPLPTSSGLQMVGVQP